MLFGAIQYNTMYGKCMVGQISENGKSDVWKIWKIHFGDVWKLYGISISHATRQEHCCRPINNRFKLKLSRENDFCCQPQLKCIGWPKTHSNHTFWNVCFVTIQYNTFLYCMVWFRKCIVWTIQCMEMYGWANFEIASKTKCIVWCMFFSIHCNVLYGKCMVCMVPILGKYQRKKIEEPISFWSLPSRIFFVRTCIKAASRALAPWGAQ